jgi:hypothetical protein
VVTRSSEPLTSQPSAKPPQTPSIVLVVPQEPVRFAQLVVLELGVQT